MMLGSGACVLAQAVPDCGLADAARADPALRRFLSDIAHSTSLPPGVICRQQQSLSSALVIMRQVIHLEGADSSKPTLQPPHL